MEDGRIAIKQMRNRLEAAAEKIEKTHSGLRTVSGLDGCAAHNDIVEATWATGTGVRELLYNEVVKHDANLEVRQDLRGIAIDTLKRVLSYGSIAMLSALLAVAYGSGKQVKIVPVTQQAETHNGTYSEGHKDVAP